VADPEPGKGLLVDFGPMGLLPLGKRAKVRHEIKFTACSSCSCLSGLPSVRPKIKQ